MWREGEFQNYLLNGRQMNFRKEESTSVTLMNKDTEGLGKEEFQLRII